MTPKEDACREGDGEEGREGEESGGWEGSWV